MCGPPRRATRTRRFRWILITAAGGLLFALLHIREWFGLIHEGVRLFRKPMGRTAVWRSVLYHYRTTPDSTLPWRYRCVIVVGARYKRGRFDADDVEVAGLYWHFVDLVWMFVVPFVYLLNVAK